ncbi:MAG: hypothetical protein ACYC7D_05215 [Nitrososphaerales archaeon]
MSNKKRDLEKGVEDLREDISMLDTMLNSLVDVLSEKGVVRNEEWEGNIKEQLSSR